MDEAVPLTATLFDIPILSFRLVKRNPNSQDTYIDSEKASGFDSFFILKFNLI